MSALDLFLPLAKVDLDQRLVSGVATAETPDRAGEIFDYASSKPYFEQWSADALAASSGKSFGAVRAMHAPIAAGKLTDIAFDDDAKRITVAAKIVDDDEWRKVQEGVYTGFSQGGRYVKRWLDPETGLLRYTADPHEISLVDLPCVPNATFDVVKDGVAEKRAFAPRPADDPAASEDSDDTDLDAENEKHEFSTAERGKDAEAGVAMPDGSYPIRTAVDVENAIRDFNRSGKKPDVKAHIIARAKAIGAENALPDNWMETVDKAAAPSPPPNALNTAPEALVKAAAALTQAALKLRACGGRERRPTKGARRFLAGARRSRKAHRGARSDPAAGQGGAACGRQDCGRRRRRLVSADDAVRRLASLPAQERALALTKLSLAHPMPRRV